MRRWPRRSMRCGRVTVDGGRTATGAARSTTACRRTGAGQSRRHATCSRFGSTRSTAPSPGPIVRLLLGPEQPQERSAACRRCKRFRQLCISNNPGDAMNKSLLKFVGAALAALLVAAPAMAQKKTLAVVVKGLDNPFFTVLGDGCALWNKENPSSEYTCLYTGPASSADEAGEV